MNTISKIIILLLSVIMHTGCAVKYATYSIEGLEITAGNYYEQIGSGLIFRSYENKRLGVDNAINKLSVTNKKASSYIIEVIRSAISNMMNNNDEVNSDNLFIKTAYVDE